MEHVIRPARRLRGTLRVPSDRSITVRALLLGSVASGDSRVRLPLDSDDTHAALSCVRQLGVQVEPLDPSSATPGLRVCGVGLRALQGSAQPLFCNASGTTMRLLAGLLAGQRFDSVLDGAPQLRRRPMRRVTDPLRQMGANITDAGGFPPITIRAAAQPLRGVRYEMPIASAQVKSALLLAGLYADSAVEVVEPAPTRDHTERMLQATGVAVQAVPHDEGSQVTLRPPQQPLQPLDITVPADFSSAAFFLVAAAILPASDLRLLGVGINPTRTGLLDALRAMGCQCRIEAEHKQGEEPVADVIPQPAALRAIEVAGALTARMIDEFPIFAVAATQAHGVTVVRDAQELRVKESNRLEGLIGELRKLGARIEPTADGFIVEGPTPLRGAVVDTLGDHRVAMALAIAGLIATGETTLLGAECVAKTYPGFFHDLAQLVA